MEIFKVINVDAKSTNLNIVVAGKPMSGSGPIISSFILLMAKVVGRDAASSANLSYFWSDYLNLNTGTICLSFCQTVKSVGFQFPI